jgi:hypothetical protein
MEQTENKTVNGITLHFVNMPSAGIAQIIDHLKAESQPLTKDATITLLRPEELNLERQMPFWHGGDMVEIKIPEGRFIISACGDVYATLIRKSDGTEMFYVKDKTNAGRFGDELLPYIKTDEELNQLLHGKHPVYELEIDHNNWWECFGLTNDDQFCDLMWALDADPLMEAIAEVLMNHSEYLPYITT